MTSYNQLLASEKVWNRTATGKGVGVAVIDTGIAGTLARLPRLGSRTAASRVVATAATNPYATNDNDDYGHGTHVAGIIAGNSNNRPSSDPLRGKYVGVAPDANLISIKARTTTATRPCSTSIYGLQFAVDNKAAYNIRVVNLSLESTRPSPTRPTRSTRRSRRPGSAASSWWRRRATAALPPTRSTTRRATTRT